MKFWKHFARKLTFVAWRIPLNFISQYFSKIVQVAKLKTILFIICHLSVPIKDYFSRTKDNYQVKDADFFAEKSRKAHLGWNWFETDMNHANLGLKNIFKTIWFVNMQKVQEFASKPRHRLLWKSLHFLFILSCRELFVYHIYLKNEGDKKQSIK